MRVFWSNVAHYCTMSLYVIDRDVKWYNGCEGSEGVLSGVV